MRKLIVAGLLVAVLAVCFAGCLGGNQNPDAKIKELPSIVNTGTDITFDGSGSKDPDGSIQNYTWDFGDNTFAYTEVTSHKYTSYGIKNIKLTVFDNSDASATANAALTVNAVPGVSVSLDPLPRLNSNYTGNYYLVNENIKFDASGTSDPDNTNLSFSWSFGDSETSKNKVAQHAYLKGGIYNVSLLVSDGYANGTYYTTVTVQDTFFNSEAFTNWTDANGLRYINYSAKIMNNGTDDKLNGTVTIYLDTYGAGGSHLGSKNISNPKTIPAGFTMNSPLEIKDVPLSINADTWIRATLFWNGIFMDERIMMISP